MAMYAIIALFAVFLGGGAILRYCGFFGVLGLIVAYYLMGDIKGATIPVISIIVMAILLIPINGRKEERRRRKEEKRKEKQEMIDARNAAKLEKLERKQAKAERNVERTARKAEKLKKNGDDDGTEQDQTWDS